MVDEMGVFVAISEWLNSPCLDALVEKIAGFRGVTSPADVDDLLQEVRIALWQKGLQQAVSAAWISRVASNKVIDMIRRRSRRRRALAASPRPQQAGADSELVSLLRSRVERLPKPLKRFYELHYLFAYSEREMSQRLGVFRSSVRALDRACRNRLRKAPRRARSR